MDLTVAFLSMFILLWGLSMVGLGIFTTYFGAGKSRIIGAILLTIGIVVLGIFYFMTGDHWDTDHVSDSFLGVVGIALGAAVSFGMVIGLMMIIKEKEPEIPGMEDWEKELAREKTGEPLPENPVGTEPSPEGEDADRAPDHGGPEGETPVAAPYTPPFAPPREDGKDGAVVERGKGAEKVPGESQPVPSGGTDDDMSEFLKKKEEDRIVKEDWEKVPGNGSPGEAEEVPPEGYSPEEDEDGGPEHDDDPGDAPRGHDPDKAIPEIVDGNEDTHEDTYEPPMSGKKGEVPREPNGEPVLKEGE